MNFLLSVCFMCFTMMNEDIIVPELETDPLDVSSVPELESDPLDISSIVKEEITPDIPECVLPSSTIIIKEEVELEETQGLHLQDEVYLLL